MHTWKADHSWDGKRGIWLCISLDVGWKINARRDGTNSGTSVRQFRTISLHGVWNFVGYVRTFFTLTCLSKRRKGVMAFGISGAKQWADFSMGTSNRCLHNG
jgi:hypothetical protein